jgi:hypothetical protein
LTKKISTSKWILRIILKMFIKSKLHSLVCAAVLTATVACQPDEPTFEKPISEKAACDPTERVCQITNEIKRLEDEFAVKIAEFRSLSSRVPVLDPNAHAGISREYHQEAVRYSLELRELESALVTAIGVNTMNPRQNEQCGSQNPTLNSYGDFENAIHSKECEIRNAQRQLIRNYERWLELEGYLTNALQRQQNFSRNRQAVTNYRNRISDLAADIEYIRAHIARLERDLSELIRQKRAAARNLINQ